MKKRTIEYLDSRILAPIVRYSDLLDEPLAIAVLPDHPTPCHLRTHTSDPVPFLIYKLGVTPDDVTVFSEKSVAHGAYGTVAGDEFMNLLMK